MEPLAELSSTSFPAPCRRPDFYLARVSPGSSTAAVAAEAAPPAPDVDRHHLRTLGVSESARSPRSTSASWASCRRGRGPGGRCRGRHPRCLPRLERRRESIILRTVGASTGQVVTTPRRGLDRGPRRARDRHPGRSRPRGLNIQILALFFTLPPPLLVVSARDLAALAAVVILTSVVALAIALYRVARQPVASVLREV